MNGTIKKLISAALCFFLFSFCAYAAQITPSVTSVKLGKNDKEISFDLYLKTEEAYAGAEFGILPSDSDVTFVSLTMSDELKNESKVQTVKDGCLYFGFFSNANKYSAGKRKIATLTYSYSGSTKRTISLAESKIVTIDENNKTYGDTSALPFTVTVTRSSGFSGGSSAVPPAGNDTKSRM